MFVQMKVFKIISGDGEQRITSDSFEREKNATGIFLKFTRGEDTVALLRADGIKSVVDINAEADEDDEQEAFLHG